MVNCPICNEPTESTTLRIDHIGGTHPFTQTCRGEKHVGPEYFTVTVNHKHADRTNSQAAEPQLIEIT